MIRMFGGETQLLRGAKDKRNGKASVAASKEGQKHIVSAGHGRETTPRERHPDITSLVQCPGTFRPQHRGQSTQLTR